MKKLFIMLTSILLLTGCWNYRELNDYAIATGMAIDYEDGEYEVSLLFANGNQKETEDTQVTVTSEKGKTIYEAIKNISLSMPKEIYISHLSVIVFSEDMATHGITPALDFLLRDPQSNQNFYIIVAKDTKAKETLTILTPLADYPSQNITANIKITEKLQGRITNASFNHFVSKIIQKGVNPISNSIIVVGNEEEGSKKEEQENSVASAYTKLDTLGLFKGDKLVGWANQEESIGINMLLGDVNILYLNLPCGDSDIVITSTSYEVKNNIEKDKITVNIKAKGMINEVGCPINLEDPETIKKYEQKAEETMKEYINMAIDKAKSLKTDIFGYGNMIYKEYPKYFNSIENWDEAFPNLKIETKVQFSLTHKGSLEQTIGEFAK